MQYPSSSSDSKISVIIPWLATVVIVVILQVIRGTFIEKREIKRKGGSRYGIVIAHLVPYF